MEFTEKMPRRRPLHTCAASCVAIAHKACTKLQDLDGPLGSTTKLAIAFSSSFFPLPFPFVYSMLYHWLAMLSIIDDHILTIETKIEMIFPQSTCLFDKINGLVCSTEVVPQKLDDVFKKLPLMIHQFPLLDWILVHLISWLNFLISILTHWGSKNYTREKEIMIDVNCKTGSGDKAALESSQPVSKSVDFEDIEKSQKNANATRNNHAEPLGYVQEKGKNHDIESLKAAPKEVIHLSVKRFYSWKSRIISLEEPLYAGDSPVYSYQAANSSPVSDCSPDEDYSSNQIGKAESMNCTYKEMLERGTKEYDEREKDEDLPKAFVNQDKQDEK